MRTCMRDAVLWYSPYKRFVVVNCCGICDNTPMLMKGAKLVMLNIRETIIKEQQQQQQLVVNDDGLLLLYS